MCIVSVFEFKQYNAAFEENDKQKERYGIQRQK